MCACAEFLPYVCRHRNGGPVFQCDGVFGASGTANAAAVAPPRVDGYFLLCGTVTDGTELADTHALPTPVT